MGDGPAKCGSKCFRYNRSHILTAAGLGIGGEKKKGSAGTKKGRKGGKKEVTIHELWSPLAFGPTLR